ncbi:helix-turn-helix transcriptional regulator [Priestia aryabhattai]|uniref:helix-turn-helix domain-containing protein n=1 Tax=Priestia TaxID=2800373 RepID=UPI001ED4DCA8|nr:MULTISPECIES: helix-turn-helix transcriptional regulator [Priestia]MBY0092601.1 helix-turn-helix transcriptional regulator [Priestia aryabhattai]MBY0103044.1 helix-turn-helix transcriptional regulator [Priestia aryabhattai]MCY9023611.1 helix-turn-helix domain-containing protein [Priestia megaterium]
MEDEFKLRGKVIQMARNLKDISAKELAKGADISSRYLSQLEREVRSISKLNEIRLLRELRKIGITHSQLVAITLIIECEEGEFDE